MSQKTSRPNGYAEQILAREQDIRSAQAEHDALALKLVENPRNEKLMAQIEALEQEIGEHNRSIARLRGAEREHERRNSVEAKRQRHALLEAQQQRIATSGQASLKLASEIERALGALTPLFARWQALAEDRSADTHAIVRATHTTTDATQKAGVGLIDAARLDTGAIKEAFVASIVATGLARVGPRLDPYVTVSELSVTSQRTPLAEAIERANDALNSALALHIKRAGDALGQANG